ncbi:hypothetical protein DFR68_105278 [Nocardia mexicana]|uniref:Nuclease-like protein n=1 Tax=Nocardia mexicana TaxID=279262 RepID=A0A370H8Y6_9NOCA|nr:hypothetical protein DFR68_105278 [Nocardia mexicana]
MKVRNDDPSRLSSTERTVVNWLKSWTGAHALSGIAVVKAHGADMIVWTPTTCVVVVVKGFTERMNGALNAADTAPWTVDGHIAPLEGVQDGTEPMAEVRARTAEIAHLLRGAPGREQVAVMGIVLVIPQLGTRVSLEKGHLPEGLDVVVGDGPSSLRAYFTRISGGGDSGTTGEAAPAGPAPGDPATWDAAQVSQALGALGFAAAATYSDLTAEGFPPPRGDRTRSHPAPEAPVPPVTAAPPGAPPSTPPGSGAPIPPPPGGPAPIPVPGGAPATAGGQPAPQRESAPPPTSYGHSQPATGYREPQSEPAARGYGSPQRESASAAPGYAPPQREFASSPPGYGSQQRPYASATPSYGSPQQSYSSPAQPYSVPFEPRPPKPMRPRGRGYVPLVLLALLVLVLAVAALCTAGSDDEPSKPAPAPVTTATTVPRTTTTDPTVPPDTPGPACFPLQPDCPSE